MNIELLDRLEAEHRDVEQLLDRLEDAHTAQEQAPLVDELVTKLAAHMQTEEAEVYPELARLDGEAATEADTEHDLAREGVAKLQDLLGAPGFGAAVAMVKAGIAHHVEEEESEAFPLLRDAAGVDSSSSGSDDGSTKEELYEAAKEAGIEGRSSMTKDELAAALDED
jgi:iron-sulfur cluster repair protein YtfE (RIC family)